MWVNIRTRSRIIFLTKNLLDPASRFLPFASAQTKTSLRLSRPGRMPNFWHSQVHKMCSTLFRNFVHLPGLEPRITDPKSVVISISPQVQRTQNSMNYKENQEF